MRHQRVRLNDLSRRVLGLLDGTHHRDGIAELLETAFPDEFAANIPAEATGGDATVATDFAAAVSKTLDALAKNCLLLA